MGPEMWKRKLGETVWKHLQKTELPDEAIAGLLDKAVDVGFRAPERPPVINPAGTFVTWPGGKTGITAAGLANYYRARGHAYFILRMEQLISAAGGLLLPRLQELIAAYEEQCEADGVDPLPVRDRIVVGSGIKDLATPQDWSRFSGSGPKPQKAQTATKQ